MSPTEPAHVIRTDFANSEQWDSLCAAVVRHEETLSERVRFISDEQYAGLSPEQIAARYEDYAPPVLYLADAAALEDADHPILCLDMVAGPDHSFRVTAAWLWAVESNQDVVRMSFEELMNATDENGVFRGYPER